MCDATQTEIRLALSMLFRSAVQFFTVIIALSCAGSCRPGPWESISAGSLTAAAGFPPQRSRWPSGSNHAPSALLYAVNYNEHLIGLSSSTKDEFEYGGTDVRGIPELREGSQFNSVQEWGSRKLKGRSFWGGRS